MRSGRLLLCSASVLVTMAAAGCSSPAPESPVIARVGSAVLTMAELREQVPSEVLQGASRDEITGFINQWVRSELLYQEARSMGYAADEMVRRRIAEATRDIIVDAFVEDELDLREFVTDSEITSYYEHNQEAFRRTESQVRYRALWFATRERAQSARQALIRQVPFDSVIADTSMQVLQAYDDAAFVRRMELGDDLGDLVFRQQPGQVSQPIALSSDRWILIEVLQRAEPGSIRPLSEVREEILSRLLYDLRDMKMDELLQRLLSSTQVTVDAHRAYESLRERDRP